MVYFVVHVLCSFPLAQRKDKGLLVNRPFSVWPNLSATLSGHSSLCYHRDCMQIAEILHSTIKNPSCSIHVMTNHILQAQISENKHIIRQIVRAVNFLAKEGLPFHKMLKGYRQTKTLAISLPLMMFCSSILILLGQKIPPISLLSQGMTLLMSLGMI